MKGTPGIGSVSAKLLEAGRERAVDLVTWMMNGPTPPAVTIDSGFNVLWRLETPLMVEAYDKANWHWSTHQ